jgi:hypothetical protein
MSQPRPPQPTAKGPARRGFRSLRRTRRLVPGTNDRDVRFRAWHAHPRKHAPFSAVSTTRRGVVHDGDIPFASRRRMTAALAMPHSTETARNAGTSTLRGCSPFRHASLRPRSRRAPRAGFTAGASSGTRPRPPSDADGGHPDPLNTARNTDSAARMPSSDNPFRTSKSDDAMQLNLTTRSFSERTRGVHVTNTFICDKATHGGEPRVLFARARRSLP